MTFDTLLIFLRFKFDSRLLNNNWSTLLIENVLYILYLVYVDFELLTLRNYFDYKTTFYALIVLSWGKKIWNALKEPKMSLINFFPFVSIFIKSIMKCWVT